jgi:hypothetical protein
MISLSLYGLFFFYQALQFLGASERFSRNCCYSFLLIAPKFFLSCALPVTSSFCLFSQSLFLWILIKRNILGMLASLYLCFLAQKHYYGPFIAYTSCFFIFFRFPKNVFVLILTNCLLCYLCYTSPSFRYFYTAKLQNMLTKRIAQQSGNSFIPQRDVYYIKRISNAWFAPMITNSEKFFYKAPQGSKLGWIYAVKTNIFFLMMMLYMMYLCIKNRKYFRRERIRQMVMLLIFLLAYNITGCESSNYLNINRHSETFIPVWLVLLGLLYYTKAPSLDKYEKS